MNELPVAEVPSLPCPTCDYDLRGQATARCPECESQFESLEAMARAALSVNRLYLVVMKWRQRLAIFTLCAICAVILMIFLESYLSAAYVFRRLWWVLLLWPLSGLLAFILLAQVIRWRFHRLIPRRQRVMLNSSIPWLLFLSAPFIVTLVVVLLLPFI
ncbi:MAG TPA: hypothetical protein P5081_04750 [Phycisphaerae bacterium]|nr:hypothetical protein [Phycisphaerae bacterium]HRW52172.1 hypothetical protein [Phycisphaerae bacterium]